MQPAHSFRLALLAPLALALGPRTPDLHVHAGVAPHAVAIRFEAIGTAPVTVHLTAQPAGVRVAASSDSASRGQITARTPADVWVDATVQRLEIYTDSNKAVRLTFGPGASDRERTLHPWGRQLLLQRSPQGDLLPTAQAIPIAPAR